MHCGGDHIIGALLHVDVIIGVHRLLPAAFAGGNFICAAGDHLIGVHVRRSAGAGLKNIDYELRIEPALDDLAGSLLDQLKVTLVEQSQIAINSGA